MRTTMNCAQSLISRVVFCAIALFGASAFLLTASQGWKSTLGRVAPGLFPPDLVVQVKALACELPAKYGLPLSRWSTSDLVQQVQQSGLVASVSGSTLWR